MTDEESAGMLIQGIEALGLDVDDDLDRIDAIPSAFERSWLSTNSSSPPSHPGPMRWPPRWRADHERKCHWRATDVARQELQGVHQRERCVRGGTRHLRT